MSEEIDGTVAYDPSLSVCWTFTLECESRSVSAITDEVVGICRNVFRCAGRFFSPREVIFSLTEYESDVDLDEAYDLDDFSVENGEIRGEDTVEYEQFENAIDEAIAEAGGTGHLSRVEMEFASELFVDGHDVVVGRDRDGIYRWGAENGEHGYAPAHDPLGIHIAQVVDSPSEKPVHTVTVDIHSDIWYDESEIGERNRERLAEFLRKLYVALNPQNVTFGGERGPPFDPYYKLDGEEHDLPFE